ncbi:MAG: YbhN family protein [Bacilli bacterium]
MKNIKKQSFILLIITSIIMIFILKDNFREIINIIFGMDIRWLLVAIGFIVLYWVFRALGMFYIVKKHSDKIKFKTIFDQTLITQFFNGVTPFSTGGQPMEIYMLKKCNISLAKSTNIVIQNFIVYQVTLVLYGIFAVIMNYKYNFFESAIFLRRLVLIGFLINTIVCIVTLFVCFSKRLSNFIVNISIKIGTKLRIVKDVDNTLIKWNRRLLEFQESAKLFINNKSLFLKGFIINLLALTCYYVIPFFLILGMGITNTMTPLSAIISSAYVLIIGSFVPIPGGTGGIEYGFLKFFGNFISGSALSAVLLIWRFITYYLGIIIGGVVFSFYKGDE